MIWFIQNDDEKPILEELLQQTDRGAALIAVAYVEERLKAAIKTRMSDDKNIQKNMFKNSGPLGTLSAKIDLAFLMGIYEKEIHKMLDTIREIRNEFAHTPHPRNFNSERIKALCNNIEFKSKTVLVEEKSKQQIELSIEPDGTPRTAFLNAIKYLLMLLDMEIKTVPHRKPASPIVSNPQQPLLEKS